MTWKEKINSFWKGFAIGMLFPMFCFFCYWLFFYSYMNFPTGFIRYLMRGELLSNSIKLCALGNLLIFYYFLNSKINEAAKGIIASVLFYVALVAYVMFYIEKATSVF